MLAFREIGGMCLGLDNVERYDQIIRVNRVCLSAELWLIKQNPMRKFSENQKFNEFLLSQNVSGGKANESWCWG